MDSEKKYRNLFSNMTSAFAYHKMLFDNGTPIDYVFLEVNDAFEHVTGLKKNEIIGKKVTKVIPNIKNDSIDWIKTYGKVVTIGKPLKFESYSSALRKWFLISAYTPEKNHFATTFEDITDRKNMEKKLLDLSKFPSENPNSIIRVNTKGEILFLNPASQFLLTEWNASVGNKLPQRLIKLLNEAFSSKKTIKFEEKCNQKFFLFSIVPIIEGNYLNIYGTEITELKQKEEKLYEQNLIISSTNESIFTTDENNLIRSWNQAAENLFGWNFKEAIGKSVSEILNPSNPIYDEALNGDVLKCFINSDSWKGELIYHKKDGTPIPVSVSTNLLRDENGNPKGEVTILHDISERKKREKALIIMQHDLSRAQKVSKTGSWRLDVKKNVLNWSEENYKIFGVKKGTPLTYETFLSTVHPDDRKYVDKMWNSGLKGQQYDIEHRIIADGKVKWVREKAELERDKDGTLLGGFGTTQDITDTVELRKKLEYYSKNLEKLVHEKTKQLKDAEKLITIGQTAGMVGHDIRNPLQSIDGAIYLAKIEAESLPVHIDAKKELFDILNLIDEQINYIDHIVADLQDFARTPTPQIENVDLQELIVESLQTINWSKNIEVITCFQDELKTVKIDPSLLKRVISNLLLNAYQAMPNGGNLTITAFCEENMINISIKDTGVGMSESIKSKIFTPLFTTKSKGQGFGLAVCKKLIEALNGKITFESKPNKGSTFIIKIPIT
ncbi:MAG: PAS domain S-box protein [Candidatus Bathyarchaeota archaeon]|nr:MAG: PAS domain S-box protein [Candidatus Bathyarchaeota archaeon]